MTCLNYTAQFCALCLISVGPLFMIVAALSDSWFVETNTGNKIGLFRECRKNECNSIQNSSNANIAARFFAILAIVASIMTLFVFFVNRLGRLCRRPEPSTPVELAHERKRQKTEGLLMAITPLVAGFCGCLVLFIWIGDNPDDKSGWRYGHAVYMWVFGTFATLMLYVVFTFVPWVKTRVLGHAVFEDTEDVFDMPSQTKASSAVALATAGDMPEEADSADVVGDDEVPATTDAPPLATTEKAEAPETVEQPPATDGGGEDEV